MAQALLSALITVRAAASSSRKKTTSSSCPPASPPRAHALQLQVGQLHSVQPAQVEGWSTSGRRHDRHGNGKADHQAQMPATAMALAQAPILR